MYPIQPLHTLECLVCERPGGVAQTTALLTPLLFTLDTMAPTPRSRACLVVAVALVASLSVQVIPDSSNTPSNSRGALISRRHVSHVFFAGSGNT